MAEATPESGPPQIPSAESFRGTPIKIISVFSFKGGVGKTTVCANMAAMIASASIRVLVIDGDPQGNLSSFFFEDSVRRHDNADDNADENDSVEEAVDGSRDAFLRGSGKSDSYEVKLTPPPGLTFVELLSAASGEMEYLKKGIQTVCPFRKLGIISGSAKMQRTGEYDSLVYRHASTNQKYSKIREVVLQLAEEHGYELVLFDLPPSNSVLNKLLLTSSDFMLMPIEPDSFSADTMCQIFPRGETSGSDLILQQLSDHFNDIKAAESKAHHSILYNDTLKVLPLVLNRVPKNRAAGTMNLEAEKWYNGMESFMRQVKWPPYISFQPLEKFGSSHVLPLFNDAPPAYNESQHLRLPLNLVYSAIKGKYAALECEAYRNLANAILNLLHIRTKDRTEPVPCSGRYLGQLVKRAEMKPYLKRRSEQSDKDEFVLDFIEELAENIEFRKYVYSGRAAKDGEVPLCNKIVEICPALPIFSKVPPGSVEFRQRKGVDLVIKCWGTPSVHVEVKYKDGPADKGLKLKMPAGASTGGISQMLDCFKNDSEHVYGLVVQKKDAQTDPSSLTMCVSKLVTASGQTPTKEDHRFFAGLRCWNPKFYQEPDSGGGGGGDGGGAKRKREDRAKAIAKGAWNDYVGIACRDNGSLRYNGFQEAHDDSKRVEAADSELRSQIQEYIDTEDGSIDEIDDHIRLIDSQRKRNSLDTWQKYKAYYAERRAPGHESPDNE